MDKVKQAKDALQRPFSFPGGYEKAIYMSDGERLCRQCVLDNWASIVNATLHEERDGWALMGVDVHWEGPSVDCPHCGETPTSEYGDPDEPTDESEGT